MSLKIAYITSTFPKYTGCDIGNYAGFLTKALSELNHDVHVITSALPEIENTFGRVTMHKIMQNWGMLEAPRLMQTLMTLKPDIIHLNHPTAIDGANSKFLVNLIPEMAKAILRCPWVTTLHGFENASPLEKFKILPLLMGSDVVTVTNRFYKQQLKKFMPGADDSKVEIVDVGSHFSGTDDFSFGTKLKVRAHWGLRPDDKVLGFFGFITPPKGFHNLIEIFAKVCKDDPSMKLLALTSWNLTKPDYKHRLLSRIEELGIRDRVIFSGFLPDADLWRALSSIDLCVFPFEQPIEQKSSGVLRQALYKSLPVLTYALDVHYSEHGLNNTKNILLSEFGDEAQMIAKIKMFFTQQALAHDNEDVIDSAEILRQGALALRPRLSFEHVANEMSRIYSKVL